MAEDRRGGRRLPQPGRIQEEAAAVLPLLTTAGSTKNQGERA